MKQPKIRFKGFEGEWKRNKLGNLSLSFSGGTPSAGNSDYYGGIIPFIRSGEIHKDKTELFLTEKGLLSSSAKIVKKETLLYALYGATSGEVDISKIRGAINQAILAILPTKEIDKYYLNYLLQGKKTHIVGSLIQGGQGNLSGTLLKNYEIKYPDKVKEQQAIAEYFKSLDSLIQTTTKKIASLKQMKSACLVSMFPQEGETKPRVRFKGFEGEWKKMNFSDMFIFLKNNSLSRAELDLIGKVNNIHYGDVLIKYGEIIDMNKEDIPFIKNENFVKSLSTDNYLQNGDLIFADAAEDNTVGKCSEIISIGENKVVSGLHTIPCRPTISFCEGFLGYCLNANSYHDQLLPLIQGSKISSISKRALLSTHISFPDVQDEQQKIASFFSSLDAQISLHSQRLEKLKQIKSACLDKMFV